MSERRLINFNNGTLEVNVYDKTMNFREHRSQDYLTYSLGYDYTPDLDFPKIRAFLRDTMPDEIARSAYAAHLGLALLRDLTMHKALILAGGKNSGKSTAYRLANMICGNEMVSGAGGQIFSEEQEGLRARATWHQKRLVAIDEIPSEALRYENTTKAMLAHSSVPMRHLNQREILENGWGPKVLFTCNEEPRFTDRTSALKRRLLFLNCPNTLEETDPKMNRYLILELRHELGAFVGVCINEGLNVLATSLYPESNIMTRHADRVELESDALKSFVHYYCTFDTDAFTPTTALYIEYHNYCTLNGHKGVLALTAMIRAIMQRYERAKGVTTIRKRVDGVANPVRGIQGLRLRRENDEEPEDLYAL